MKYTNKKIIWGIALIAVSGLNIYLPEVGNLFDFWRVGFSLAAFIFGWAVLVDYLTDL